MGVYIKGMKMPKSCWSCFCSAENVGLVCNITGDRVENQGRSDNCPLAEVPTPHGKLIDADEMANLWKGCTASGSIAPLLEARPAIIEPEGEDG